MVRVYRNALPEHTIYRDEGCELAPACLDCWLPRCKDEPYDVRPAQGDGVLALAQAGVKVNEIARVFGLSRRTVFRRLRLARAARA